MNGGRTTRSTRRGTVLVAMIAALLLGTVVAVPAEAASPGTAKKSFSNTTPVSVPDGSPLVEGHPGEAVSTIEVSGLVGKITKVTASVHITHGRTSDLDAAILPPDPGWDIETYAYLFQSLPSSGSSLGTSCADEDRLVFDDAAETSVEQGSSPFVGIYRPQDGLKPLSTLNNNAGGSNGTWLFDVIDSVPGVTGTIECWSLFIDTDADEHVRFDSSGPVATEDAVEPSGPGVASSTITTSGLKDAVTAVTVSVWITHPNVNDLEIELVSPSGAEVTLAAGIGGTGDNYGSSCSKPTTFDDTAKTYITSASAPFVGSFRPQQQLGRLKNDLANGQWTLRVSDTALGNFGMIKCWTLTVTSSAPAPTPPPSGGVTLTPRLTAPAPLPGTYNYTYFTITNDSPNPVSNLTLTSTLSSSWTDVRKEAVSFPNCDVAGQQITCTYPELGPGASVIGGAVAKVNAKGGKVCLDGAVTAADISPVRTSACFALSSYPKGDRGTGYAIGDRAHDISLQDQNGNRVSLSDFAGKYVLLQFTSVWCPPSNFEVPQDRDEIAALNASNAMGAEIVYLTVLIDGPTAGEASTQQHALSWAARFDLTTPVLFTRNDTIRSAIQQHASYDFVAGEPLPAVPTSIFIRPDGQIFDVRIGLQPSGDTTDRFLAALN